MKVMIAGGGTAGHINPGIAIAKYIKSKREDAEILFIGTKKGLEAKLVEREGFALQFITVRGFKRKLSRDTFLAVKELFQGLGQARKIIREYKPDVVIGTGGYVCGPVVFIASRMGIPTLIHEQNAFPGATNRILSRFANAVAISFKESEQYFKSASKLVCTGNPVRAEIVAADRKKARQKLNLPEGIPFLVAFGGSLGADKINSTLAGMIRLFYREEDFKLLFATGNSQFEKVNRELELARPKTVEIVPYIYDAANVYAAADLIVCRAGAITCSELTVLGTPSIMIPSPNVAANHQEYNARSLEKNGASVVILERDLNEELLYRQITELLNDKEQLARMSRNAKKIGISNAAEKIYLTMLDILKS